MFSSPHANIGQFDVYDGMQIVDLGAGSGFYTIALAKAVGQNGKVYAIDIQKTVLDRIGVDAKQQNLHNVELIQGNVEKIGGTHLGDESVGRAIASNIFFQLSQRADFIKEVWRILKPGGQLLFIDWKDTASGIGPRRDMLVVRDVALKLFEESGFQFEKDINAGDHHYGFVVRKKPQ